MGGIMKIIFEKVYDGESLNDLERDIVESLSDQFNPIMCHIPIDDWGFPKGEFKVTIEWSYD
jgi:hypothetical protein